MSKRSRQPNPLHTAKARAINAALDASMSAQMPDTTADSSRNWGWQRTPRDARADTLPYLGTYRGQSRALIGTNALARGAIRTNTDRVVGTGLALSASPSAQILGWSKEQVLAWKAKVQAEFSMFADGTDCDHAGKHSFYELQGMVLWGMLASGDIFSLLPEGKPTDTCPYTLRIQLIEADRVGNPLGQMDTAAIAGGIKFENGRPQSAYIYDQHPGGFAMSSSGIFSGAWVDFVGKSGRKRLLHHARLDRPDQPRGTPYLAPVINDIKRLGDYADAEVKAAVISAFYALIFEAPPSDNGVHGADSDAEFEQVESGFPGKIYYAQPGEKVNSFNATRPNPNFEPFFRAVSRNIGMGLGIPVELLLKEFNASYSASKAALLDAWMYLRNVRMWLARSFCQPVYETWMAEAVIKGRISAPSFFSDPLMRWAYTRALWPGDSMGSINPKDEVAAYTAAIDARLMTRERAEWELFGSDWYETLAGKETEQTLLKQSDLLPVPKAGAAVQQNTKEQP